MVASTSCRLNETVSCKNKRSFVIVSLCREFTSRLLVVLPTILQTYTKATKTT